jgi:hypothetical protein
MRKSRLRLYAPFIAIVVAQALFIAFAPSKGPSRQRVLGGDQLAAPDGAATPAPAGDQGFAVTPDSGTQSAAPAVVPGGPTPGANQGRDAATDSAPGPAPTGPAPAAVAETADRRHCTKDGLQHDVTFYAPPCVAKWAGGPNGGATYQGVTEKEIKVVWFRERANEQVAAILATQGLAAPVEEQRAFVQAALKFIHQRYELYGRRINLTYYEAPSDLCPQTPPRPETCREAARRVIAMKPFMIFWGTSLYSVIFDEFARAGIIALGGWHFDQNSFNTRRPFRYDFVMDGTRSAQVIGDYYCKKLANKPASHSGQVIHSSIGVRGQAQRKLGIIVPDDPANVSTARGLSAMVSKCDGGRTPPVISYESNIERAAEQTTATTAKLISEKVTTVTCMCDPIAPVFGTKGFTSQGYFPELLMSGMAFSDYDIVGRLYDERQMAHAFGPSHLFEFVPFDLQDHSKAYRSGGGQGQACSTCGIHWGYMSLMASMLQGAGPNLNPLTVERFLLSLPGRGGVPLYPLIKFGPGDYTGIHDTREVFWSASAISKIDGKPGAFVSIDGGRRTPIGQYSRDLKVPVSAE